MVHQTQGTKKSTPTRCGPYVRTDFHRDTLMHVPAVRRNYPDRTPKRQTSFDGGRGHRNKLLEGENQDPPEASLVIGGGNFPTTAPSHMFVSEPALPPMEKFDHRTVSVVWEDQTSPPVLDTGMLSNNLELLRITATPRLSVKAEPMTPVLVLQKTEQLPLPPELQAPKKHSKFIQKIVQLFHRNNIPKQPVIEEKSLVQTTPEPNSKHKSKIFDFLHLPASSHQQQESTLSSSDISLNDEEFQVIKERLPNKAVRDDLSFSKKYHFTGNRVVGKGASGIVRLGVANNDESHPIALKQFRKKRRGETAKAYLMKLTTEFEIASKLDHPNVVKTLDIVHDGNRWYEVMEYCSGGDLFAAIKHDLLDIDEIDYVFSEIVQGVHYLHSLGVAHRDLKPENLLVDQDGRIKITDFGVSDKIWEGDCREVRKSHGICGSSPYIAPEEFTCEDYDGRAVDVWAIAIIYYTMVFHTIPWDNASMQDPNYRQYIEGGQKNFEPFKRLSFGARTLLKRMLEPVPSKRITIDEILEDQWFKDIEPCPIQLKKDLKSHS